MAESAGLLGSETSRSGLTQRRKILHLATLTVIKTSTNILNALPTPYICPLLEYIGVSKGALGVVLGAVVSVTHPLGLAVLRRDPRNADIYCHL